MQRPSGVINALMPKGGKMSLSKEKTEEIIKKIEDAIKKKTGQNGFKCPVCTNDRFSAPRGFTADFLTDTLQGGLGFVAK